MQTIIAPFSLWSTLLLAFAPLTAIAITRDNSAIGGSWSTPTIWDINVEPNSSDDVIFPFGLAGTITTTSTEQALSTTFNDNNLLSGGTPNSASANSINAANRHRSPRHEAQGIFPIPDHSP